MAQEIEKQTANIPESVTIGGVTYAVKDTPELQQFIQEISKVEKSKLYSQFETLKAQIASLQGVSVVPEQKQDFETAFAELKKSFMTKEDFKEMLPGIVKEVVKPVLDATEQNKENELKQYREKLIAENSDKCFPELVKGSTKQELDKSLQDSIALRTKYPTNAPTPTNVKDPLLQQQQAAQQAVQTQTPTQTQAPNVPNAPAAPSRPTPPATAIPNVKQMTMKEFAQQRDSLRAKLDSMYGNMA